MTRRLNFKRKTLEDCHEADGVVVVIDVLRAFTTAAVAFAQDANEIVLVSTVAEALELKRRYPDYLLVGEVNGLPVAQFDLPNSPSILANRDLRGRGLIQRTSAGTQGVVRAVKAQRLFAASLCVGKATAQAIRASNPAQVTFVETGICRHGPGEEDVAGTDYVEELLRANPANVAEIKHRVESSCAAQKFLDPDQPDFPERDLDFSLMVDEFDFALEVSRRDGLLILESNDR